MNAELHMTRYSLQVIILVICQFLQDIIKIDQKQMKQELEPRSTLENRSLHYHYTTGANKGRVGRWHLPAVFATDIYR